MPDLHKRDFHADPFQQFQLWFEEAAEKGQPMPEAMGLGTVDSSGQPEVRMLLLKGMNMSSFFFYTNYESRKAQDIVNNPNISMMFWWETVRRQVRVSGKAEKASREISEEYFRSRPRDSQLGAWTSPQSKEIPGRTYLTKKFSEMERRFEGEDIPCPPFWGGYRVIPNRFEFWQENQHRVHDRFEYLQTDTGWRIRRLGP
ncbi:pyridoxamine 5'-phosphate oxidase [Sulfidibacter corallicola]|uniref:Pyridoxamine 5'-phosphate oxidase n=1 Tax=Sulfidibacter corallicola TaxID=2818388 RepID=A0A8A4TUM8_SULCO|nr:pyridoxamine 5'-phosphate oxidase [Sulfidibacter corallicola]QTD53220.1 pyridoxamine 5'-phosphate oxidase [Sulfidibacter corallicola]